MERVVSLFYAIQMDDGKTHIISTDKRQMARWYAMDYLREKPQSTDKGYRGVISEGFYFTPAFRRKK